MAGSSAAAAGAIARRCSAAMRGRTRCVAPRSAPGRRQDPRVLRRPSNARRGIGSLLLERCEREAAPRVLGGAAHGHVAGVRLYAARGYASAQVVHHEIGPARPLTSFPCAKHCETLSRCHKPFPHPDSRRRNRTRNHGRRLGALDALGAPFSWTVRSPDWRGESGERPASGQDHRQHPAHAPRAQGPLETPSGGAIAPPTCAFARSSSCTRTCARRARSFPAGASTTSIWWWCARISKASTSGTSTSSRSTTIRTRSPWPRA